MQVRGELRDGVWCWEGRIDVGGSRSVRQHWIPYFDDVQAIIFLAPLAFNLTLDEDPKVNRLVRALPDYV